MSTSDYQELLKRLVAQVERVANALEAWQPPIQAVPPADDLPLGTCAVVVTTALTNLRTPHAKKADKLTFALDDQGRRIRRYRDQVEIVMATPVNYDGLRFFRLYQHPDLYIRERDVQAL